MALFRTTTETSRPVPATKRPHATIWSPGSKAVAAASERCPVFAGPLSQLPGEESRKRSGILVPDRGRDAGDGPVRGLQEMPGTTHAGRLKVIERALAGLGREPPEQRASTDIEGGRQRDEVVAVGQVLVELSHDPSGELASRLRQECRVDVRRLRRTRVIDKCDPRGRPRERRTVRPLPGCPRQSVRTGLRSRSCRSIASAAVRRTVTSPMA